MAARAGPLATIYCEPRQAWKGAAAAIDSGAGVWRVRVATLFVRRAAGLIQICSGGADAIPSLGAQVASS